MRDAPAVPMITALQDMGAQVRAYDPASIGQAKAVLENVTYGDNAYACADGADALVIATEWDEFRALDLERLRKLMKQPVIVDLRNIYPPEEISRSGFDYSCVGRVPGQRSRSSTDRRRK
jgi:UDPglucose 6-dehydrogenase